MATTVAELIEEYPALTEQFRQEILTGDELKFTVEIEQDKDKRITLWTETARDRDGKIVSKRVDTYTYKEGKTESIEMKRLDDKGLVISTEMTK